VAPATLAKQAPRRVPAATPKPEDRIIGRVLRSFREARGLSQEDAAFAAGIHRAQYGRYEAGYNAPSFLMVVRIAQRLGVPAAEIAEAAERELRALEEG
jgi:transcriptional regulator with XRE-family HTH domain